MAQDIKPAADRKKWQVQLAQFLKNAGQGVNEYLGHAHAATRLGAAGDLGSYIMNELTKYPGTRDADPKAPMFDTVNNTITNLLGMLGDPVQQAGGPSSAVIAPTSNKILQSLFTRLRERAPKLVQQAEAVPETVFPYLVPREVINGMTNTDVVGLLRRSKTLPKSELYVRGGRPGDEQVDTLAHELRHFLTGYDPAMAFKSPEHSVESAQQISHMMPPPQQHGMQSYLSGVGTPGIAGTPMDMLKATQGGARKFSGAGTAKDPALAFDEALSYLTESLMGGNKGGDPALESIAQALGQGLK